MVFTKGTEYAIKALSYMAKHKNQEYFGVRELADFLNVSSTYLAKILQKLVHSGFVKSVTGPGGGFGLNKQAENIRLIDIIDALGDRDFLEHCVLGWSECGDKNPCPFHLTWKDFRVEMKKRLESHSILEVSELFWPEYWKGSKIS